MAADLNRFLDDLASFIRLTSGREEGCTESVAEATLIKLDSYLNVLYAVIGTIESLYGCDSSSSDVLLLSVHLQELADMLGEIKDRWCDYKFSIKCTQG